LKHINDYVNSILSFGCISLTKQTHQIFFYPSTLRTLSYKNINDDNTNTRTALYGLLTISPLLQTLISIPNVPKSTDEKLAV